MQIIRDKEALGGALAALRAEGGAVALVPTMGALHSGHAALIAQARRHAVHVAVSIFVNPLQFGPQEDLDAYPRREASDARVAEEAGASLLWVPDVATMYPAGFATTISVAGLGEDLCGAARPRHFDGVATVVAKLFGQVRPDVALFGEKDYQQLAIIRRLVADLDLGVAVIGVPTQRDADGVALSSRNAYLTADERKTARALPRALGEAAQAIIAGTDVGETLARARERLGAGGFDSVDYFELRDAATLASMDRLDGPARLLAAAFIGRTRLIDNLPVHPN